MTTSEQLAKEIAEEIIRWGARISRRAMTEIIAARIKPVVEDAERFHKLMEINDRMQKAFGYDD